MTTLIIGTTDHMKHQHPNHLTKHTLQMTYADIMTPHGENAHGISTKEC